MKRNGLFSVFVILVLSGATVLGADAAPAVHLSGFAERDITPAIGLEQPGSYTKTFSTSLHDPCKVRAAVFSDGKTRVAIASLDAPFIRRETVVLVRQRIEQACGIPGTAVMLHATHSHSSGPTGMILPGEYDAAPEHVRKLAYEISSCADPAYLKHVEDQTVDAVVAADAAKTNALSSVGVGHLENVTFNRRFFMRNGMTFTHPRQGNPDIVEPAGPIDPEVGVIGVWDQQQKLVGCVVNFCCHATTNPGGISANYVFYLEQVIRSVFGQQVIVVFLAGPSGDVTQVDNLSPYVNPKPEQWARMVGGSIGAEAVKVLFREEPGMLTPIAYETKTWQMRRRAPSAQRVAECEEIVKQGQAAGLTRWIFAKEIVMLNYICQKEPQVDVEVQAMQIGPVLFLTNPAELFCELGLQIKAASPFALTFPVSLANGYVAYVPTLESFGPRGGGYETRLTSYSNMEITAGPQLVEAAIELSKRLTPGVIPTRAPAPPYKSGAWEYGSVPPELD